MKTQLISCALLVFFMQINFSCNSTESSSADNPTKYEQEKQTILFDGNFKGQINKTAVNVSLKNSGGNVTGTYSDTNGNYSITGNIDANETLNAKMNNGLFNLDCKGYYEGYNLVLELDETLINLFRLAAIAEGQEELAAEIESKLVLEKQ